jgi:hypothetical protein
MEPDRILNSPCSLSGLTGEVYPVSDLVIVEGRKSLLNGCNCSNPEQSVFASNVPVCAAYTRIADR